MIYMEEKKLKGKILVLLVTIGLLVGVLSGCIEEKKEEPANVVPTAIFDCIEKGDINEPYTFTSASTDSDGTITNTSWSIEDVEVSTANGYTTSFDAIGDYTITLTVTDNDGAKSNKTCTISIDYKSPDVAIEEEHGADVNITVNVTQVNFTCTVTEGSGVVELANYTWDFGDDSALVTGVNATSHTYNKTGTFTAKLTVTDSNSKTGEDSIEIIVVEAIPT